tara:strand:- start:256 stop:420 length:165 start_codon:yes stop_codon:yes gene_type:complete
MNEILNGSGQGTRRFYLNENFQRVWIDMPSNEWQKQALIDNKHNNKNQNETKKN